MLRCPYFLQEYMSPRHGSNAGGEDDSINNSSSSNLASCATTPISRREEGAEEKVAGLKFGGAGGKSVELLKPEERVEGADTSDVNRNMVPKFDEESGDAARLMAAKQAAKDRRCNYTDYLQLDRLLSAQIPQSDIYGHPQHDEMLFIIIHQTYELWFKQIIHEIDAVLRLFSSAAHLRETYVNISVQHLKRSCEILKVLVTQLSLLETMTPISFLGFRDFIDPASGFQSSQFRILENKLGLLAQKRYSYQGQKYHDFLSEKDRPSVLQAQREPSLFDVVEHWLVRMPFVEMGSRWDFVAEYRAAVAAQCAADVAAAEFHFSDDTEWMTQSVTRATATRDRMLEELTAKKHEENMQHGSRRLCFRATMSALMIMCYRDEPLLHGPAELLDHLVEMDMLLATWRFRHSLLVHRMLGAKPGTGGSPGVAYLRSTVDRCRVFNDLCSVSSLLLPRDALPSLPAAVKHDMQFAVDNYDPGSFSDDSGSSASSDSIPHDM